MKLNLTFHHTDESNRVPLRALPGQKKGDILPNAHFIDGFQKSRAYIATKDPIKDEFDSFWRMVWEHKVRVIALMPPTQRNNKVK